MPFAEWMQWLIPILSAVLSGGGIWALLAARAAGRATERAAVAAGLATERAAAAAALATERAAALAAAPVSQQANTADWSSLMSYWQAEMAALRDDLHPHGGPPVPLRAAARGRPAAHRGSGTAHLGGETSASPAPPFGPRFHFGGLCYYPGRKAVNIEESLTAKGFTPAAQVPLIYRRQRTIESITIHHWGAPGQTHDGVVNFFVNGPGLTSAHFVCSAGRTTCLVSPKDAAWHAGNPIGNATSVGIECRPEASEADYREVAALVSWLRSQHGANLPLIPHRAWQATACPGKWDLAKIDALARGLQPAGTTPAPSSPKPPVKAPAAPVKPKPAKGYVKDPHWVVDPGDTVGKIAAHYGVSVRALTAFNGIKNANKIKVGEVIWPPVGLGTWTVDPGDTVSKIVAWVRTNWSAGFTQDDLCYANGINDPSRLKVGDRLKIARRG